MNGRGVAYIFGIGLILMGTGWTAVMGDGRDSVYFAGFLVGCGLTLNLVVSFLGIRESMRGDRPRPEPY